LKFDSADAKPITTQQGEVRTKDIKFNDMRSIAIDEKTSNANLICTLQELDNEGNVIRSLGHGIYDKIA